MPYPKLLIYPHEFALLTVGVRLQQLQVLAVHGQQVSPGYKLVFAPRRKRRQSYLKEISPNAPPWYDAVGGEIFDRLIMLAWRRFYEIKRVPQDIGRLIDEKFEDIRQLVDVAKDEVRLPVHATFSVHARAALPRVVEELVALLYEALPSSSREAVWLRLGRCLAASEVGERAPASLAEIAEFTNLLHIDLDDLAKQAIESPENRAYGKPFEDWAHLDTVLQVLERFSTRVKSILDEPFNPTPQQSEILRVLPGKAMKTDELGETIGSRRDLFSRKGGRDHLFELRVHGMVGYHPNYGYFLRSEHPTRTAPTIGLIETPDARVSI